MYLRGCLGGGLRYRKGKLNAPPPAPGQEALLSFGHRTEQLAAGNGGKLESRRPAGFRLPATSFR
jgi:hypothetical protein